VPVVSAFAPKRLLILGGTAEGRRLAAELAADPNLRVTSSLAGRTGDPLHIEGEVRIGGFGGVDGLVAWLRAERIEAVVDATHPFAEAITAAAARATEIVGVPLLTLSRPGWERVPGDDWRLVGSMAAAAELLPALGERVFLTIGRQRLATFARLDDLWFLIRSVEPPEPPMPARRQVVLARGPFTVEGELALMREHRIDVVVSKHSGGEQAAAKLSAARELGLPVVLVDRPAPTGATTVPTVREAVAWVRSRATADS
jgi:precorrin-6A/cobalt-precorrin-6A reductase